MWSGRMTIDLNQFEKKILLQFTHPRNIKKNNILILVLKIGQNRRQKRNSLRNDLQISLKRFSLSFLKIKVKNSSHLYVKPVMALKTPTHP